MIYNLPSDRIPHAAYKIMLSRKTTLGTNYYLWLYHKTKKRRLKIEPL